MLNGIQLSVPAGIIVPHYLEQQVEGTANAFRCPDQRKTVLHDFRTATNRFLHAAQRSGMSIDRQQGVLSAVHRLLSIAKSPIRYSDRFILACQILSHAAAPNTVTCGGFRTSAAAALEHLLYVREPQLVAEIVSAMALSGFWKAPGGNLVRAHRSNLLPAFEQHRSYASQLTQSALTNDMLSRMPGAFRYVLLRAASLQGPDSAVLEGLFSNGKFVESFSGIPVDRLNEEACLLLGTDSVAVHADMIQPEIPCITVRNEVDLFDLLYEKARLPVLALIATTTAGTRLVVITAFDAPHGQANIWDPRTGETECIGFNSLHEAMSFSYESIARSLAARNR